MSEVINQNSGRAMTRRTVLCRLAITTGVLFVTPTLLAACGSAEATPPPAAMATSPAETAPSADEATASCAEDDTLATVDQSTRAALGYVVHSTNVDKQCANCRFFKKPESDQACGGCQILQGPIAPTGYCNSWVTQST